MRLAPDMQMSRFSVQTEALLKKSGWFEGRSVPDLVASWSVELESEGGFQSSPVARDILTEFGGLHIKSEGPGEACARSDLNIDPSLVAGEEDRFRSFDCFNGKRVFPIGEAIVGHVFAAIDESGTVYLVIEEVRHVADSFEAALEHLLRGLGSRLIESAA